MDDRPAWDAVGRFSFGDGAAMADDLLALVLSGRKTATCWAKREGRKVKPGWRLIVTDSNQRDRALIAVDTLELVAFGDVPAAFAHAQGEGDRSLAGWRDGHRRYFKRNGGFAPTCGYGAVASG